jgi:hypothetical protein
MFLDLCKVYGFKRPSHVILYLCNYYSKKLLLLFPLNYLIYFLIITSLLSPTHLHEHEKTSINVLFHVHVMW